MTAKKKAVRKRRSKSRSYEGAMEKIRTAMAKTRAVRKRYVSGEDHGLARFTNDEVRAIRHARDSGEASIRALAKIFKVTPGTISHIVKRRTYRDVED